MHAEFLWKKSATPVEIAQREFNIKYVYVGNISSVEHESTFCPGCGEKIPIYGKNEKGIKIHSA